ncbi:hypothetical protein ABW20_dc0110381 [Dactylellina cionopaga]|nr:hypothetical protein ABW20_dc0110381 [Dactylellina cionopaga]
MKWSLSLCPEPTDDDGKDKLEVYTMFQWLSAHFLSLASNTGQRKFLVKPGASILSQEHLDGSGRRAQEASECIHIWVFNPNTLITRSNKPTTTRALKVYYQNLTSKGDIDQLGDMETVYLPTAIYDRFRKTLNEGNANLPKELRIWGKDWKAGWLERF